MTVNPANVTRIETLLRTDLSSVQNNVIRGQARLELSATKSVAVDRAYDDYCRRIEDGEDVDVAVFCESHVDCHSALLRCIELHHFLDSNPETLDLLEPIPWPNVGDVFGGKTILEELGRGGVGRVYLAQENELPRRVVLKVSALDNGEASRLSRLEHDNIVPIYYIDHDEATGLTAMCMPFQGRHTLHDLLDAAFRNTNGPLGWAQVQAKIFESDPEFNEEEKSPNSSARYVDEVLKLGVAIADALQHCHDQRIYHLDLKPSNILLTSDGTPKLIDFGVSTDDEHRVVFGGTKPYMSPEQIRKILYPLSPAVRDPDGKSDTYSLAVILCQLLTGKHPFADIAFDGTEQQLLLRQQEWDSTQLRSDTALPASIARVLGVCLSAEPDDRPTADDMARSLERLLTKPARTRRWVLAAGLAAASAGGVLAVLSPFGQEESAEFHYQKGMNHAVNRQWDQAVDEFTQAINTGPVNVKYLSARASAYCLRNHPDDYRLAREDYAAAYRKTEKPKLLACLAYCDALLKLYDSAILNASKAANAGFRNAAVENIEGYAELMAKGERARAILRNVVETYPDYQPGWYNRALIDFEPAVSDQDKSVTNAIRYIEKAMEVGPAGPMLLYHYAGFLDLQIRNTPNEVADEVAQQEKIRTLLVTSLKDGLHPTVISTGPLFRPLVDVDPELQRLIADGRARNPRPYQPQITHPLESSGGEHVVITD